MKLKTFVLHTFILLSVLRISDINAQSTTQRPGIGRGSLESQFNYMIYESEKVENNRIVKSWWMYNIKNQVNDTLTMYHDSISYLIDSLVVLNTNIDTLNHALSGVHLALNTVTKERDTIKLLGITLNKKLYKSIMWTIIGFLVFALVMFIILFKRSNIVTVRSKNDLQELKEEFESFRKKSLVREQQLVRKLYDEVLKYKNKVQQ